MTFELIDLKCRHWCHAAQSLLIVLVSICAAWHVWDDIVAIALTDSEASCIFLVPLIVGWLVWCRRDSWRDFKIVAPSVGIVFVAVGCAAQYYGDKHSIISLWHLSAVLLLYGGICFAAGVRIFLRFPAAALALFAVIPIPGLIRQELSQPLQYYSAVITRHAISFLGIPIEQHGCVLSVDGSLITVAEACSGMRMLSSVMLVVFCICYSAPATPSLRASLLLISPSLAVFLNVIRIMGTVLTQVLMSRDAALAFHDLSGWLFPLILMTAVIMYFNHRVEPVARMNDALAWTNDKLLVKCVGTCVLALVAIETSLPELHAMTKMTHHAHMKDSIESIPYAIGDWVAEDIGLRDEEMELLRPHAGFRRIYRNVVTDQRITLFIVACKTARALVGHEPGICYVGQGWHKESESVYTWANNDINGHSYGFRWPRGEHERLAVFSILVTPNGDTTGNPHVLARAASDHRMHRYGAAAIQLSTRQVMDSAEWEKVSEPIVDALEPLIECFTVIPKGRPTGGLSRMARALCDVRGRSDHEE